MRILIHPNIKYSEEIDCIGCGFAKLKHEVMQISKPIYLEYAQSPFNILVMAKENFTPEYQLFIDKYKVVTIVIDEDNLTIVDNKHIQMKMPQFANTVKYRPGIPNNDIVSDILIFTQEYDEIVDKIYKTFDKVKTCSGNIIAHSSFVGIVNLPELITLTSSSKIVVCPSNIMGSLLYNNICAINIKDTDIINNITNFLSNRKLVEDYILQSKKDIQVESNVIQSVLEKI